MSAKKAQEPEAPQVYVVIQSGKRKETFKCWMYYQILNALRFAGIGLAQATETAKWARTARSGEVRDFGDAKITAITM